MAGYLRMTKSMERHFSNAEQDAVRCAFLPTSFVQIRKLPAKMRAGTLGQGGVVISETSPRGFSRGARSPWMSQPSATSPGLLRQRSAASTVGGTLSPRRFGVGPKMFSMYAYLPSEYDLARQKLAEEKVAHSDKIIGPPAIKTGTPSIPSKQGAFTHFRYEIDPYESKDEYWHEVRLQELRQQSAVQNFTPGGRFVAKDDLKKRKASQHELISRLSATLQSDWPEVFRSCFVDKRGLIVCFFTSNESDGAGRTELRCVGPVGPGLRVWVGASSGQQTAYRNSAWEHAACSVLYVRVETRVCV